MVFLSAGVLAATEGGLLPCDGVSAFTESPRGMNGSPTSCDGDTSGVCDPPGEDPKLGVLGTLNDACRPTLLDEGEARRERVLRKVDLRFGGEGSVDTSIGSLGSLADPSESASLACSSTISVAVRVRVRLCVGVFMYIEYERASCGVSATLTVQGPSCVSIRTGCLLMARGGAASNEFMLRTEVLVVVSASPGAC